MSWRRDAPAAAVGIHGGIKEAAEAMSGTGTRYEPDENRAATYDGVHGEIYSSLRFLFPKLTEAPTTESVGTTA